jgi:hypothetical protein
VKRYNLQEGDGVHVYHDADLMLVMNGGRPALSDFDLESVRLEFHWNWVDYPVRRDEIGFYAEVDDDAWEELQGTDPAA